MSILGVEKKEKDQDVLTERRVNEVKEDHRVEEKLHKEVNQMRYTGAVKK